MIPAFLLPTLLGVALLALLSSAVLAVARAPSVVAPLLAILRGVVQLAVISVILSGVIREPLWVVVALAVMFAVAAWTAAGRLGRSPARLGVVAGAMGTGVVVTLSIVFLTGSIQFSARYALAIGGIVIGNTMTTATLAGRRFTEAAVDRWEQVEGWLAIGATPRQATADIARRAIHAALIPSIDQTRTTGLVTLPGAFVGAIFGGVSPLEAGRFQIVVLAAILAAGSLTALVVVSAIAPLRRRPAGVA